MGRAISVIESDLPSDKVLAEQILDGVLPRTGKSRRIGITKTRCEKYFLFISG